MALPGLRLGTIRARTAQPRAALAALTAWLMEAHDSGVKTLRGVSGGGPGSPSPNAAMVGCEIHDVGSWIPQGEVLAWSVWTRAWITRHVTVAHPIRIRHGSRRSGDPAIWIEGPTGRMANSICSLPRQSRRGPDQRTRRRAGVGEPLIWRLGKRAQPADLKGQLSRGRFAYCTSTQWTFRLQAANGPSAQGEPHNSVICDTSNEH